MNPVCPAGVQLTHVAKRVSQLVMALNETLPPMYTLSITLSFPNGFLWQRWHYKSPEYVRTPRGSTVRRSYIHDKHCILL